MPFEKGGEPGPGRPIGKENKKTRDIKEVVSHLVSSLENGRLDDMLEQLFIDKPEAVLNFIAKIAPKDLNIQADIKSNPLAEALKALREKKS